MTNKLSSLQEWINEWTKVPGAEDMDIEAAHRLGCFDGAMWLLEQLEQFECARKTFDMEHREKLVWKLSSEDLLNHARKLCGKQEAKS